MPLLPIGGRTQKRNNTEQQVRIFKYEGLLIELYVKGVAPDTKKAISCEKLENTITAE